MWNTKKICKKQLTVYAPMVASPLDTMTMVIKTNFPKQRVTLGQYFVCENVNVELRDPGELKLNPNPGTKP